MIESVADTTISEKRFAGQVAIITGAASGIGLAIALKLHAGGAAIILFDIDETQLQKIFGQLTQARPVAIDLTNEPLVEQAVTKVFEEFKRIDILVNCAGMTGETTGMTHEVSTDNLRKVFELNFMSCFYTSRAVLPYMLKRNYGRILHLASIAGKEGNVRMLAYSASKAALIGMTKVQGKEYAETGITINALAPAVINTPLVEKLPQERIKYMTDKIPMKRCGTLEEVSDLAAFIVSAQNSFTTGFTYDLTGGRATY